MIFGRIARLMHGGDGHHDWISRDWLDIDCQAVGCMFNRDKKCMVPSRCKIADDGRCLGFLAKQQPKQLDGD